jgi:hypothetical protein
VEGRAERAQLRDNLADLVMDGGVLSPLAIWRLRWHCSGPDELWDRIEAITAPFPLWQKDRGDDDG